LVRQIIESAYSFVSDSVTGSAVVATSYDPATFSRDKGAFLNWHVMTEYLAGPAISDVVLYRVGRVLSEEYSTCLSQLPHNACRSVNEIEILDV
jgi:hypothetical protein